MRVTFLGTSGAIPSTERNPSALLVERDGDRLLFDCGEGTQRQMMRFGTGFDVGNLFVTHLHGDHVLGIPGLLQTWDFHERERPVTIHTPEGTRDKIEQLVAISGNRPSYGVRINPVSGGDVALDSEEYAVRGVDVQHRTQAVGYALVEDERKGRFDRETAEEEFGIPPGPKYSRLHAGEPIEHDGRTIQPEEVVGPPRPGRRLVYTGDTRPTESVVEAARDADLLIHDGSFAEEHAARARETAHSTAREAAGVANEANAKRIVITHISTRYGGAAWRLEDELEEAFSGETALVAADGMQLDVPYPDGDREFTVTNLEG